MRTCTILGAAALLLGLTGLAHAGQTIASPVLPVPSQFDYSATCYVRNVGTTPVSVTVHIFRADGSQVTPAFENCNSAPLGAGKNCVVGVAENGELLGCSATATGLAKYLRGTMEVRYNPGPGNTDTLVAEELR